MLAGRLLCSIWFLSTRMPSNRPKDWCQGLLLVLWRVEILVDGFSLFLLILLRFFLLKDLVPMPRSDHDQSANDMPTMPRNRTSMQLPT